jgi:hypothetical protein
MSPGEIARRARDEVVRRRLRREHVTGAALVAPPEGTVVRPFRAGLPALVDVPADAAKAVVEAADELLAGRWPIFDRVRDDMAPAPDWFLDVRTGRRAPDRTYAFDVPYRREDVVGNVKYVWEASRHQHLTVLAAAYRLTGDERYADRVATHLRSWWQANPFLSGVHWTSGIEVGVRLLSWVWIRRLLDGWEGTPSLFDGNPQFLDQLAHHQRYLELLPSHGSSANNHVIAEAAGQFAASCAFPWFPTSDRWREDASATLRRELDLQTFPSGLNRELATGYHGFVLELGLAAALEGEVAGHPLDARAWGVLRRMTDALAAVVDVGLRPPRQGDDDEGAGLLLDAPHVSRWAGLLATGGVVFGALDWWPAVPADDARTPLWTALLGGRRPDAGDDERPARRPSVFPDAGLVLLRDAAGRADELWCRADSGPHGYLSIGAHGHADALAVEVRVGGVDVVADPGTYCYHGEPAWRSFFRSTVAHATLEVDGRDSSVAAGPFLWSRRASARIDALEGLDEDAPVARWAGSHDGYAPVRHRRAVTFDRAARRLVVTDRLDGARGHGRAVRLAFPLGPDVECELRGAAASLRWPGGTAELALPTGLRWEAVRGREGPVLGWWSGGFGEKRPATALIGSGRLAPGAELVTTLDLAAAR